MEIIQQWQCLGKVRPELLEDEVLENCKRVGVTSLQSYVYWAEIEKEKGKIDFSSYDVLVEKLKEHNLRWVPFLILGPEYATPKWFQESEESVCFKCLEHQKESKIQSIWNPYLPKYIDRFLKEVAGHYKDKEIFESITLGISGNWGEAIYPVSGGFYRKFHTHLGWWCADQFSQEAYGKPFPALVKNRKKEISSFLVNALSKAPRFLKKFIKSLIKNRKREFIFSQETGSKVENPDFIRWYLDSMTDFAELWLKTARQYFPNNKIYLVTGGTGLPAMGADFSKQSKVAAKYGAGIRITNQTNSYGQSFILTRLVASACRFYGSYFTTEEEAVLQSEEGVVMRIFDAASSGADGFYCKNIVSQGNLFCIKEKLPAGQLTPGAKRLREYLNLLDFKKPIIETAVFFPSNAIALNPEILCSLYDQCAKLRDVLDLDLVDENMIKDGALDRYQYLLVLEGEIPKGKVSEKVEKWKSRGRLIEHPQENDLRAIKEQTGDIDNEYDGVYATKFQNKVLYYNSNNKIIKKDIPFLKRSIEIKPNSICELKI